MGRVIKLNLFHFSLTSLKTSFAVAALVKVVASIRASGSCSILWQTSATLSMLTNLTTSFATATTLVSTRAWTFDD